MVVSAALLSANEGQSSWPLPVTRLSDTVYASTNSGRVQEMVAVVAVSDDAVMFGGMAAVEKKIDHNMFHTLFFTWHSYAIQLATIIASVKTIDLE